MLDKASCSHGSRFGYVRGVQWRVDLGILPSSSSASVDDLRRLTADSRRRYAAVRRQLLVDPHVPKDGSSLPDRVMDNPLSQNPDSMWGQFFKNAELEKMVDQDLARLYPERGSYFQTSGCQDMLRRILLLWCLQHPEYGYRQGMHELLAPMLYVLQVDVERLSQMKEIYGSYFADKFDGFSFHENDLSYKFDFKKFSESVIDGDQFAGGPTKSGSSLSELDPEIQMIAFLSDVYGAEGELGIVLSEKFLEHDAYCMFDALMTGAGGAMAMAEFFSPSVENPNSEFLPVIEASAALYRLLSVVDSSLHRHLVELKVEPQYFALRWLRVLFGREFSLEDLLVIWDEIFHWENTKFKKTVDSESSFEVLESPRGAFIVAFSVSMIRHLRSLLLATENATTCLQRLLNFPGDIKLADLLEKAKSLYSIAVDMNTSNCKPIHFEPDNGRNSMIAIELCLAVDSSPLGTPLSIVPDSYWEQKWRFIQKEREHKQEKFQDRRKDWSEKGHLRIHRTESDPSPAKDTGKTKIPRRTVRRSVLKDLAQQLGIDEENASCDEDAGYEATAVNGENVTDENNGSTISGDGSGENVLGRENSVASTTGNDAEMCGAASEQCLVPTHVPNDCPSKCTKTDDSAVGQGVGAGGIKDRKLPFGMFQWMLKFGRKSREGTSPVDETSCTDGSDQPNADGISTNFGRENSSKSSKGDALDHNLMGNLKNLGKSMLENIQVIESAFQQDRAQTGSSTESLSKNGLVGKGQVTAITALKELRKMSNLLSEM